MTTPGWPASAANGGCTTTGCPPRPLSGSIRADLDICQGAEVSFGTDEMVLATNLIGTPAMARDRPM